MENTCLELKYDQIADVLGNQSPCLFHLLAVWFLCESVLTRGAGTCSICLL